MANYNVQIGCSEWQSSYDYDTFQDAEKCIEEWEKSNFTMGLYSATYAWIENTATGEKVEYNTGHIED